MSDSVTSSPVARHHNGTHVNRRQKIRHQNTVQFSVQAFLGVKGRLIEGIHIRLLRANVEAQTKLPNVHRVDIHRPSWFGSKPTNLWSLSLTEWFPLATERFRSRNAESSRVTGSLTVATFTQPAPFSENILSINRVSDVSKRLRPEAVGSKRISRSFVAAQSSRSWCGKMRWNGVGRLRVGWRQVWPRWWGGRRGAVKAAHRLYPWSCTNDVEDVVRRYP